MVDLVFVLDILVNCNTAYMEDGDWVVDRARIVNKYVWSGWFAIDVLSVLPLLFDVIAFSSAADDGRRLDGGTPDFFRYFKLLKSARLVRALKIFKFLRMNRVLARLEYTFIMKQNVIQMLNFLVVTLLFCHFFACLFYLTASQNRYGGDGDNHRRGDFKPSTWIARHGLAAARSQPPDDPS